MNFAFRLCRDLKMTLKELPERMSKEEFIFWLAFDRDNPLPDSWMQTGVIASMWTRDAKPSDFIPRYRKPLTAKQIFDMLPGV